MRCKGSPRKPPLRNDGWLVTKCGHADAGKGGVYIGPKYFKGPINLNIGQTKEREPKNAEAQNPIACARLYDMTEEIMQPFY